MADKDAQAAADGGDLATGGRQTVEEQSPYSNMQDTKQSGGVQQEIAEQARQAAELLPISKTIEEFIEKERADIQSYHSYATAIFARNGGKNPTPTDIEFEFRAREIYLAMLDRLADKVGSRTITLEKKLLDEAKAKDIAKKRERQE